MKERTKEIALKAAEALVKHQTEAVVCKWPPSCTAILHQPKRVKRQER